MTKTTELVLTTNPDLTNEFTLAHAKSTGAGPDYLQLTSLSFASTTTGTGPATTFALEADTANQGFLNRIVQDTAGASKPPLYIDEYAVSVTKGVQHLTLEGTYTLLDSTLTAFQQSGARSVLDITPARYEFTAAGGVTHGSTS